MFFFFPSEAGEIPPISIRVGQTDITSSVMYQGCTFTAKVNGSPGVASFVVVDRKDGLVDKSLFIVGKEVELRIDNQVVWGGFVNKVDHRYPMSVVDTTDSENTPTMWEIEAVDWNILFMKRFIYNTNQPTKRLKNFPAGTTDKAVIEYLLENWINLGGDGIDTSGVKHVGTPGQFEKFRVATPGDAWGKVMSRITLNVGSVFYISPDKVLHYVDDEEVTAPKGLSDRPGAGQVGYRDCEIVSSAADMANDILIWGAGNGSPKMVFSRSQSENSIDTHGRFQYAELRSDMYKQTSADRRANTYLNGSPQNRRGHKNDHVLIKCTVFEPTFRVGHVVDFESEVHDFSYVGPIREMEITFPTNQDAQFNLTISKDLDPGLTMADPYKWDQIDYTPQHKLISGAADWWTDLEYQFNQPGQIGYREKTETEPLEPFQAFVSRSLNEVEATTGKSIQLKFGAFAECGTWISNNTAWPLAGCVNVSGFPIGYGKWGPETTWAEQWFQFIGSDVQRTSEDDFRALIIQANNLTISGYNEGVTFAIAQLEAGKTAPDETDIRKAIPVETFTFPESTEPDGNDKREVSVGDIIIPYNYRNADNNWLVVSPARQQVSQVIDVASGLDGLTTDFVYDIGWKAENSSYCDPGYANPGDPYEGKGPAYSGQGKSGKIFLPLGFTCYLANVEEMTDAESNPTDEVDNLPSFLDLDGSLWKTRYPYEPGSLRVFIDGNKLRKGSEFDFIEVEPDAGTFRIFVPGDLRVSHQMTTKYKLGDDWDSYADFDINANHSFEDFDGFGPLGEPGEYTGGLVYRPKFKSQLGWGTPYDGINCVAAAACVAVDRHTNGTVRLIPPYVRSLTGDFEGGLTLTQMQEALMQINIFLEYKGFVSFKKFQNLINEGRGALCSGDTTALLPWNLTARSEYDPNNLWAGPHALYINEQRSDGAFFVYDPAFRKGSRYGISPGWYPREAIARYLDYKPEYPDGKALALYTQKTPRIR